MHIHIARWYLPDATVGRLVCGDFQCFTLEKPDQLNLKRVSCILPGEYTGFKRDSPSNGPCIQLEDKNGREYVQIHLGNFLEDTVGCILVGDSIGLTGDNRPWVKNSGTTLSKLLELVPDTVTVTLV